MWMPEVPASTFQASFLRKVLMAITGLEDLERNRWLELLKNEEMAYKFAMLVSFAKECFSTCIARYHVRHCAF